jgi:hypothetical protein
VSILGQVQQPGQRQAGQRIVIAAQEKVGKTTLAMGSPDALLIPLETDNVALSMHRHVPPAAVNTWQGVIALCDELRAGAMAGRIARGSTLVWDSATALERIIHNGVVLLDPKIQAHMKANGGQIPKVPFIELHGGYGKAYNMANNLFEEWTRRMDELASYGGINVVVTCHVFATRVMDPTAGEFDTWDLLLHSPKDNKTYGKREFITQWADLIGFLHEPIYVTENANAKGMNRGMSAGQGRILGLDRTPAYVAGNRYQLSGTIPIPLQGGWNALAHAVYNQTQGRIDIFNRG